MQNIYPDITTENGITWDKDNWACGCNFNDGTCGMKTGSVTKGDAFITNDETMVCGIII